MLTALSTPFSDMGAIDWDAFDRLIDRQPEAGVAGLVPVDTTGKAATLDKEEALSLIAHSVRRAGNLSYVMARTSTNVTSQA